jgi:hypothetical protein
LLGVNDFTNDRVLHVDAPISVPDYFRVYLDLAKLRLLIAVGVIVVLIASFTYFFILIGETKILLELSVLFFGLPIVGIVGQLLRVHAEYRKYIKSLSDDEKNVHFIFREGDNGFDIVRGSNFSHIGWPSVRRVVERPTYFRFELGGNQVLVIMKKFLKGVADESLLRQILVSNTKAKLID